VINKEKLHNWHNNPLRAELRQEEAEGNAERADEILKLIEREVNK